MTSPKVILITSGTSQDSASLSELPLAKRYHVHGGKYPANLFSTDRVNRLYLGPQYWTDGPARWTNPLATAAVPFATVVSDGVVRLEKLRLCHRRSPRPVSAPHQPDLIRVVSGHPSNSVSIADWISP